MLRVVAASLVFSVLMACRDEADPVDVPFEGVEPTADADRRNAHPPDPDTPATGATGDPAVPVAPQPNPNANAGQVAIVQGCCAALRAAAKRATEDGTRAVNQQAALVCEQKAQEVRVGRTTASKALSAVRGSLLTSAPAACKN